MPSLPDSCTFEQAALAEPLSVLIHATRRAGLTSGQTVLVYGVGAIGLLACSVAQSKGAARVVAIDNNQTRLNFAKDNGFASQTFCLPPPEKGKTATTDDQLRRAKESAQAALSEFGAPEGFDIVFECTGAEPVIQMSVHVSHHFSGRALAWIALVFCFFGSLTVLRLLQTAIAGGKVMLIGMGTRNVMLPLSTAALREVDIQGSFRYANTYPAALELLASGQLKNIEKLITHRFPLQETKRAFELLSRGQDEEGNMVLKVMIGSS
jgi:L-iditol 2-dehydrogenase